MINSFYLPYFDQSMINLKFFLEQPIHTYEYFHKCNILQNYMSKNEAELFPSTKVLTGIALQHRGKLILLPFPILSQ